MADPTLADLPEKYFSGGAHVATGGLARMLKAGAVLTRLYHAGIVTPSSSKSVTGKEPTPIDSGALLVLAFTLNVDAAWRQFKIPNSYVSTPAVHIHWTKTSDANEAGKAVKWRVSYRVFDGSSEDASAAPSTVEYEDTYDDAGTTTRIVYRTPDLALVGFEAIKYLALKVEAITPVGTALASEPGLFSCDITYQERINS